MSTVNPVQTTTYYLTTSNNPITFGAATNIDASSGDGVFGNGAASWTVTNAGAINATGFDFGIVLVNGGTVNNLSGGTISGGAAAVDIQGGSGVITNAGVATGDVQILASSGNITNLAGGMISASKYSAVYIGHSGYSGSGAVTNAGTILAAGRAGVEINFSGGSNGGVTVNNESGGTISTTGNNDDGVSIDQGGAVTNAGKISATGNDSAGVEFFLGDTGAVTNTGTISATGNGSAGLLFSGGGMVNNQSGGTISGGNGEGGVVMYDGAGTVENAGTITGTYTGVGLIGGGTVDNMSGGMISATDTGSSECLGVYIGTDGGKVTNAGAISAKGSFGFGVAVGGGTGTVTNSGSIGGGELAVDLISGGTVNNQAEGTISGGYWGIYVVGGGGTIKNQNGGTISGGNFGVYITGGSGSVTDAGAISGGTASVEFAGSGANTLTLQTGSTLNGPAIGSTASGATDALILEGTGTASNNFDNFNTLTVKATGDWTLGGDSTIGAATVSSSGTLTVTGDLDVTGNFANAHDVLVSSGTLNLQGAVTGKGMDEVSGNATLEFGSTVTGNVVDFSGPSTVELIDPTSFAGRFENFTSMDTVDLAGDWIFQKFKENAGATVGTLTLENVATNADLSLKFEGDYTRRDFTITPGTTTTTIT
jgi:hypothetical protein